MSIGEEKLITEGDWLVPVFFTQATHIEINRVALTYYRFERIVQDIAEWGELMLFTEKGDLDRLGGLKV